MIPKYKVEMELDALISLEDSKLPLLGYESINLPIVQRNAEGKQINPRRHSFSIFPGGILHA